VILLRFVFIENILEQHRQTK